MARQVSLTRTAQRAANQGYATSVAATGTEMPSEIFVMRRRPLDPLAGTTTDGFDHVATPGEIASLPVNAPLAGSSLFRKASVSLSFADAAEADEAWAALRTEVDALIRALNAGDDVLAPETVVLDG